MLGATNRSVRTACNHRHNPDYFSGFLGGSSAGQDPVEPSVDLTPNAGMVIHNRGSAQDLRGILLAEVALRALAPIQGAMDAQIVAKPQVTEEVI